MSYVHLINADDPGAYLDNAAAVCPTHIKYQILVVRDIKLHKPDKLADNTIKQHEFRQTRICPMDDKEYGFGVIIRSWNKYSLSWIHIDEVYGLYNWSEVKEQIKKFIHIYPYAILYIDKSAGDVNYMCDDDKYIFVNDNH